MISALSRFCIAVCLIGLVMTARPAFANDDEASTRITIFLSSADDIIADLEHLVVDLADEEQDWEDNVFPNIDIFLIGVDYSRPIFFDQVMDSEHGQRPQYSIPVADLDEFILDNLDPLGIIVTPVRRQDDYYELEDVYEGWMRIVDDYAAFGEHESDVPEELLSPAEANEQLLSRGYDAGVQLNNALTSLEQRTAAFTTFRENTMAGIKKRPQETNEEFALRELNTRQNLEVFERVFVQSSEITIGLVIDSEQNEGRGDLLLTAVPESDLAATIGMQVQEHSEFALLESADDAALSGRVNFTFDELLQQQVSEFYPALRPVLMQQIDEDETLEAAQKEARKEIAGITLDMLEAGGEMGVLDAAIEMSPAAEGGMYNAVLGIRVADGAPAEQILELLPESNTLFESELNVDEAGEVSIHKLTISGDYSQALADFFGEDYYVGTGPDAVWLGAGPEGLELLKSAIETVGGDPEGEVDTTIARLDMQVLPVLRLLKSLKDEGTLDVRSLLMAGVEEDSGEGDEDSPASMLKDFEWGAATIEALSGEDDRLHMEIDRVEDHLEGDASLQQGMLKAIGELIAKFARENLG